MPKSIDRFAILLVSVLCAAWGGNQVAAKIALADFGPMTQCALRNGVGATLVGLYALAFRPELFRRDGTGLAGVAAGALFALEFILLFFAVQRTTAASAVVFLFTAPFFVALGALAFLPAERLFPRQWLGVAVAFAGVALGFWRPDARSDLLGDILALLAGVAWGATTLLIKATGLRGLDPTKTLLYQVVVAALVSAPLAFAFGEPFPHAPGAGALAAVAYQAVFVTGVTYLIWFWLLKRYRAPELSALTFISPVVGVVEGWLILGETLTPTFVVALAGVAAGIVLLSWPKRAPIAGFAPRAVRRDPG